MPAGRPTEYNQDIANRICTELAEGRSLRSVLKDEGMPGMSSVFRWLSDERREGFRKQYALAKEEAADALADDIQDIADKVLAKEYDPQSARVAMDGKKWIASKLKPKRYGEKLDMTSNGKDIVIPILGGTTKADNVHTDDIDS